MASETVEDDAFSEKEDGELSTHSFESGTSTPLSLSISQIRINGAESPFTDISSPNFDKLSSEEDEEEDTNELEQEKERLLKQIEKEMNKKKKKKAKKKKSREQLLKDIAYLKQVTEVTKKKKKSKKKLKSKISKRRNTVVGIARQDYSGDDIRWTPLNEQGCEDDRLFPSLHEVRATIPTPCTVQNDIVVTIKGASEPERVPGLNEKEHVGTSHDPHSKSKKKRSTDSRNKSPRLTSKDLYDEIESCSEERSEPPSVECRERSKSPVKTHHARHGIKSPTDARHKHKTKSKSPHQRQHSQDENMSHKMHTYEDQQLAKNRSSNKRPTPPKGYRSRDQIRASRSPTKKGKHRNHSSYSGSKSISPHYRGRSPDYPSKTPQYRCKYPDYPSKSPHYRSKSPHYRSESPDYPSKSSHYGKYPHLRRKSCHSNPDSGHPRKGHPRHRSSSSSSSSSFSSVNSEHSVKFIDFLVKSVIKNKKVVEVCSRTSSQRGSSPASDKPLPLHLNTTSTFFNATNHPFPFSTTTPASPEIQIINEVAPISSHVNPSIAIDINKNDQLKAKKLAEPIPLPPSISPEQIVPEGERTFSSLLSTFPFTSENIAVEYHSNVQNNPTSLYLSNIPLPVPPALSHHSDDNLSNYDLMSMDGVTLLENDGESMYDPFETSVSTEHTDHFAKSITVIEGTRGGKESLEGNVVPSRPEETRSNHANLITVVASTQFSYLNNNYGSETSVENNAIKNSAGQSGCNSKENTVLERNQPIQEELGSGRVLANIRLGKEKSTNATGLESDRLVKENPVCERASENSQLVNQISRSEAALDNTRLMKENHGNETNSKNTKLEKLKTKTALENTQSMKEHVEKIDVIENIRKMNDFLDSETVGASTQVKRDNLNAQMMVCQRDHTAKSMAFVGDDKDLDIELGFEGNSFGPLPKNEDREILIHQLELNFLLQNPVIPDYVANGVAEFFAELQRVLCVAAFNNNVRSDNLHIEKWFVIINSIYYDLIHRKNQFTFAKIIKYYHVLDVILDHFRYCVKQSIRMYAEELPLYVLKLEAIHTWLNCHPDKKKMLSSVDHYATLFFKKNNKTIKEFLFHYHFNVDQLRVKKLKSRKVVSKVVEENPNVESNCPIPKPSKPYQDIFEVTNKIDNMLMLIDDPKCYEMFEKISSETLEHLLTKIHRELQDVEAEVYSNKCKELIKEKSRITNLKEYIEKMYKHCVVENNVTLPEQIKKLTAINNDLKSWNSTSSLKQKIKEILLKHEKLTVEANKKNDDFDNAKESAKQGVETIKKDDTVEIVKPTISKAIKNPDYSAQTVKPMVSQAIESHKKDDFVEIVKPIESKDAKILKNDTNNIAKPSTFLFLKEKIKEILLKHKGLTVEADKKNDGVENAKESLLQAVETNKKDDAVEIEKPTVSKATETLDYFALTAKPMVSEATEIPDDSAQSVKLMVPDAIKTLDDSAQTVKPIVLEAIETPDDSAQTAKPMVSKATETLDDSAQTVKSMVPEATEIPDDSAQTVKKPMVSEATENHKKDDCLGIVKTIVLETTETRKKNDIVQPNAIGFYKKDHASVFVKQTVSNTRESHKKRNSIDSVKPFIKETENLDITQTNDRSSSVIEKRLPIKKNSPMDLDDSGSSVSLGNESSQVIDPRLRRQSINTEPGPSDPRVTKMCAHVVESIVYKLIPLDVPFIPFIRARNELAGYSKRKKAEGESFRLDPRLEKDKMRLKQEIQEKEALSETNEGISPSKKQILKDVHKSENPAVVKAGVEKTRNSTSKKCDTVDLVKRKDPRHQKKEEFESNSKSQNVNDQEKSVKNIVPVDNILSRIPLPCSQIIESSCGIVHPNNEFDCKKAENEKLTINTDLDAKHSKFHPILTTKSDIINSPCENNRTGNSLKQTIEDIETALKPKTTIEQVKSVEGHSWSRIPFQGTQNSENFSTKIQKYKIPKAKIPPPKNIIPESRILKSDKAYSGKSKPSKANTEGKKDTLLIGNNATVLKATEIDSGAHRKCSQTKIQKSNTLQVERKTLDIDNLTDTQKTTEKPSLTAEELIIPSGKNNPNYTEFKKKSCNKQISESNKHALQEKISKLEKISRNMSESSKGSEKIFNLFGETQKSLKNKTTSSENKDGNVKIKSSVNNVTEKEINKSKLFVGSTEDDKKRKDEGSKGSEEVSHKTKTLQSSNEPMHRNEDASGSPSSNCQHSKKYTRMKRFFMETPYLESFRTDSKLFDCRILLDSICHESQSTKGLLKRKISSWSIEEGSNKKKRINPEGKQIVNIIEDVVFEEEESTENTIENLVSENSINNIEKKSNITNEEGPKMSNKKVDCSKGMENTEKAKKYANKSDQMKSSENGEKRKVSERSEKAKLCFNTQVEERSPKIIKTNKNKISSNENNYIKSSLESHENVKERYKPDEVISSENKGKEKDCSETNSGRSNQVVVTNENNGEKIVRNCEKEKVASTNLGESGPRSCETGYIRCELRSKSREQAILTSNKENEISNKQINMISESNEYLLLEKSNDTRPEYNALVTKHDETSTKNGESRYQREIITTSNKDDKVRRESSEKITVDGKTRPSEMGNSKDEESKGSSNEVNLSGNNEKEIATKDDNEEVKFIESINAVSKKRALLNKKVNVKQAWERMRRQVAESKLTLLRTTATSTLEQSSSKGPVEKVQVYVHDLELVESALAVPAPSTDNASTIEKDSAKLTVRNNAPKPVLQQRFSLDSSIDRCSEKKLPIKINLRRCSEDTWMKVKEHESEPHGVHRSSQAFQKLNMLKQQKQNIEKAIVLLKGQSTSAVYDESTHLGLMPEDSVGNLISKVSTTESDKTVDMDTYEQSQRLALSELSHTLVNNDTLDEDKNKSSSSVVKALRQYRPGPKKRKIFGTDCVGDLSSVNESSKLPNSITKTNIDIPNQSTDLSKSNMRPSKLKHSMSKINKSKKTKVGKFNIENFIKGKHS
ncbi:hypothetical protein WDU94_014999 [Cyamophila willieti]